MTSGLLDTSVFIARESGRALVALPDRVAVYAGTIGELELGVLAATDEDARARRADTLALARMSDPLAVTEPVVAAWAPLVPDARRAGAHRTITLTEALIAATAVLHGLPVVTQDGDVDRIASSHPVLRVLRV